MKKWGLIVVLFLLAVGVASAQIIFTTGDTLDQSLSISSGKGEPALGAQEIVDISTCLNLQDISEDLSGDYQLVNDIDCSDTVNWNGGEGFDPLGNLTSSFTGTFNGQNHTITNLFINRSAENYVALFGYATTGFIKDIALQSATIYGGDYAAGLVGRTDAAVSGCFVSGQVEATNHGALISGFASSEITQCTSEGKVTGDSSGDFGGSIGELTNIGRDLASTANVTAGGNIGGLVGYLTGSLRRGYAKGLVTDSGSAVNIGGLVGDEFLSSLNSNIFWDQNTSNQSSSAVGVSKSTAEMKNLSTFTDTTTSGLTTAWDFQGTPNNDAGTDDIWDIDPDINGGYPYLKQYEQLYSNSSNQPPTHEAPMLNATDNPLNTTNANLTAYNISTIDAEGDNITNTYDWRLEGTSLAVLNLPFTENSSTTAADFTTFSNDCTPEGTSSPTWTNQGQYEGAYEYFGTSGYLNCTSAASLDDVGDDGATFMAWIKYDDLGEAGNGVIFTKGEDTLRIDMDESFTNDDSIRFGRDFSDGFKTWVPWQPGISSGTWFHLAITFNDSVAGGLMSIFINGEQPDTPFSITSGISGTAQSDAAHDILIGSNDAETRAFDGIIDELMYIDRLLTDEQINNTYQEGLWRVTLSNETSVGENWSVAVTPGDASGYGTTRTSNTVQIQEATKANGESCTANGDCTSGYCADSFYNGSDQADLCCAANSCVAGGTCHADLATYGGSTCYDGVWIAGGGQFIVRNQAGAKQFVVDKWGSAVLAGERNASCTTGAPNDSFLIDIVGGQDTWINASGFMCDASASINTRTTPLASLGGTDHFSIVNATRDIVFQRWGVGGSPLHMLGDFADQVGTIS